MWNETVPAFVEKTCGLVSYDYYSTIKQHQPHVMIITLL